MSLCFHKVTRTDVRLSQATMFAWFGKTEQAFNEQFNAVHFGEDGPGYDIEITRCYSIADQAISSGELREYLIDEFYDTDIGPH